MMVIPAYVYDDHEMHRVVIIGEVLAIAAIVMCLMFVVADLGRPDRFWHMMPGHRALQLAHVHAHLGRAGAERLPADQPARRRLHHLPALPGARAQPEVVPALRLPLHRVGHLDPHGHGVPLRGLGGGPFWNSALLAPRFLASAFVTGPAFIVLSLQVVKRTTDFYVPRAALTTLVSIIRVTAPINLFMLGAEVFSEFYAGGAHVASARYLFLGLHGHSELVPWIWTAISFNVFAAVVLLTPASVRAAVAAEPRADAHLRGRVDREGHGLDRARLHPVHAARDRAVHAQPHGVGSWS
jgi:hypothetical protein